jgi:hypothetical protein
VQPRSILLRPLGGGRNLIDGGLRQRQVVSGYLEVGLQFQRAFLGLLPGSVSFRA